MIRTLILAAGTALIMQGGAVAQSQGGASGFLPAMPDLPDIRSDSRRTVRHLGQGPGDKADGELAGAPASPRYVEDQAARYERLAAPMPAPVAQHPAPQLAAHQAGGKGPTTADIVMSGGGPGSTSTQYQFNLDNVKPN